MFKEIIKDFFLKIKSGDLEKKQKICLSASIGWVLLIGYLTWWNGIKAVGLDKSFKWDEWFWFGIWELLFIFFVCAVNATKHTKALLPLVLVKNTI